MPFTIAVLDHGYGQIDLERELVAQAGGMLLDLRDLSEYDALAAAQAEGIMVRRRVVDESQLAAFKSAKIIVRYGVGVDNIDVDAATRLKLLVGHVPVYCVDEVSNHAICLLLACVRELIPIHQKVSAGRWDLQRENPVHRTRGKTAGIVGLGNIGSDVARKLKSWGMRLLAADPYIEPAKAAALGVELVPLEQLLRQSDFVTLHLPLLPETHHLINEAALALMKPSAILINTARGPIVDTEALRRSLDAGRLHAAGLDVFEEEPIPATSPLLNHPSIVVTDHMGWYSEESLLDLRRQAVEEAIRGAIGKLPHYIANPDVLKALGRDHEWAPPEGARWWARRAEALALAR